MNKFLITLFIFLLLIISLPFVVPAKFLIDRIVKNSNFTNISYSYIEGNFFSGNIFDLTYNNNLVGDFSYDSQLSPQNLEINFFSIDENAYSGTFKTDFLNLSFSDFTLNDIKLSNELDLNDLGALTLDISVKKATFVNNACASIEGSLVLQINDLLNKFEGDLYCLDGNKYGVTLLNKSGNKIGSLELYDSKIRGSLSTEDLLDRRLALFTDKLSFTIDL
tara:strand:+ start:195 stop:857 length:663 start_codon:yes stop_codon:yes gene_type:complete